MAVPLFTANVIAIIWDFDQTLIPGYQQGPMFEEYGIDPTSFWQEVNGLEGFYKKQGIQVSQDTIYLNHILTYVAEGRMGDLTNAKLRELGSLLTFYEGVPEILATSKGLVEEDEKYKGHGITVEHYVVSTGLRQVIQGSAVAPDVKDVWACEFIGQPAAGGFLDPQYVATGNPDDEIVSQVGYFLDNTTKTRAIWEINKGCNVDPAIQVNDNIAPEDRRVPLQNMVYVADGPSDIPVFSILNKEGGRTLGVYNPASESHYKEVKKLNDIGRVQSMAPADYREGQAAYLWITTTLREIADNIVTMRDRALTDRVQPATKHVT